MAGKPAVRADQTFTSGPARVALLELFSSEGCSSCPPAEQWLGQFRNRPELWRKVVPVAWHVNYWDRLGWQDIYASKSFTARQYAYAKLWGARSVYTPGFALNGREWRRGEDMSLSTTAGGLLEVVWHENKTAFITYTPPDDSHHLDYNVTITLLGGNITSDVLAGENSGRELHHEFVALQMMTADMESHPISGQYQTTVRLPAESPPPAPRHAIAVWVTGLGDLIPLQATGGWLN